MTRREFQFVEGSSSKFWAVAVSDATMTVQFGKVGTGGQAQAKAFGSDSEARAAAEKLIAEKTRKGYKEVSAAPPAPAAAAPAGVERRLRLSPDDWRRARWREQPPVVATPWPAPRPFDFKTLQRAIQPNPYEMPAEAFRKAGAPQAVTVQEARFWLHFLDAWSDYLAEIPNPRDVAEYLARITPTRCQQPVPTAHVTAGLIRSTEFDIDWEVCRLFAPHLPPAEFVEVICSTKREIMGPVVYPDDAAPWFEAELLPRLAPADLEAVKAYLRGQLRELIGSRATFSNRGMGHSTWERLSTAAHLAVPLDLDESRRYVECLTPPLEYTDGTVQAVLLGVRDREFVEREARRLKLCFNVPYNNPRHARAWLAHTEHDGLDHLAETFPHDRTTSEQKVALDVLLLAESPEAARALLTVRPRLKSAPLIAKVTKWLDDHPECAAAGLTPLAGEATEVGRAAAAWLDSHRRRRQPTAAAPGEVAAEVRAALDAARPPKKPLPPFADPGLLPPLPGFASADAALVLDALRNGSPLVATLRDHGDRPALAAFAWALFDNWLSAGAPPKENWAMLALGPFGDDATVRRLTPLLRSWPGEGQHKRAVSGLEVLRAIGTDAALVALNGIALKVKFKALQERARELMDLIANDRGLSREQLEDRIVPDLGLDADGGRTLDFGPRRFRAAVADDLTPLLTDEGGKELKDLPKPGAKDDAAKAAGAAAEWRAFKAQLRDTAKVQLVRLEQAMVTGRAWTADEFRTLLVAHPLMACLVRRLVWQGPAPFRVADGGRAVGHGGAAVRVGGPVRVAHRLRLTPGQVNSWRAALDKLGIEPPFPQLERPAFTPPDAAALAFPGPAGAVPAAKLRGTLEGRGWLRLMDDHGTICGYCKPYPQPGVTAVMMFEPGVMVGTYEDGDQRVTESYIVAGTDHDRRRGYLDEGFRSLARLTMGAVDPVAFSETVRDVMATADRGK